MASTLFLGGCPEHPSGSGAASNGSAPNEESRNAAQSKGMDISGLGVDASGLTPRERSELSRAASELMAPCPDVATSVGQCVAQHRACGTCDEAVKFIALAVHKGVSGEALDQMYKARYDATTLKKIPTDGSPALGPDAAKVTIVEFADFECPHCKERVPELDGLYEAHKNDVRVIYKFFPLPQHVHAEAAARAAYAAGLQGKFWEMHHAIYENQLRLEQADLEKYAKKLGLDVARFKTDMTAPAAAEHVERDRKLGDDLGVMSTPALFINGREFDGLVSLEERVNHELEGGKPSTSAATPPSAASSSVPASKPAPRSVNGGAK